MKSLVATFFMLAIACLVGAAVAGDASPADAWSIEQPVERVPDEPLRGSVFGHEVDEFTARVSDHAITLESTEQVGRWPAWSVTLFVGEDDRDQQIVVTPATEGMVPHIHMAVGIDGRNSPGRLMYIEMYSMRLTTETNEDGDVECALHLSLPDHKRSHLIGRFVASP